MAYKLYYFDGRGLAEPIRMILSIGGVKFEDIRAPIDSIPASLPSEIKEKCTWGQVPLIEFEGKKLAQSLAITRYFAKKFNLVGSNDFEAALTDEYVDSVRDFNTAWMPLFAEKDEAKKAEKIEEIKKVVKPKFLVTFNKIVKDNDGKHLVGKNLTWADIYLAHILQNVELIYGVKFLDEFPALKSLSETVFSTPQIKKWVETRPKTKF